MSEGRNLSFANGSDWFNWFDGIKTKSGVAINEESAQKLGAVHQAVDVVARTIASFPWRSLVDNGGVKSSANDHPVSKLIKYRPNHKYGSHIFRKVIVSQMMLWGAGCAAIKKKGNVISSFEIKHPANILTAVSPKTDELYYYDVTKDELFHSDDFIYVLAHSKNGIDRKSIIQLHRDSLGTIGAMENFNADFWGNNTFINGFLETDQTLKPEQKQVLAAQVKQGLGKAGGVGFLEYGMKFNAVGMAMKDAEFIANRKFSIEDIARIFGVPPWMIGHYEGANFNSSEQMMLSFINNTVRPYVCLIDEEFTYKVFQNRDEHNHYTKLEMKGLMQGDVKTRAEWIKMMLGLGVYSIDEVRALEDLNPLPDDLGKIRVIPSNMIALNQVEEFSKRLSDKVAKKIEQKEN